MQKFFSDSKLAIATGILGVVALSFFGSLFLISKTVNEVKNFDSKGEPYYNSINVSGKGEVVAIADIATFNFAVNEEGKKVEEAQSKATEKINKAIDYLKSQGIEDKDIKTVSYNVNPKYEWQRGICNEISCDSGKSILVGYEVSQSIDVKVRETVKAGEVLAGIGTIGISNVSGLQFKVDDEETLKSEARTIAIENAKKEAEKIAKDLGVKLVRVISYYEESEEMPYGGYGMGGDMMEAKVSAAPQLPTGENKVTSKVSVSFEIK